MKIEHILVMVNGSQSMKHDIVHLTTDLPSLGNGKGNLILDFKTDQGKGIEYVKKNFPGIVTRRMDLSDNSVEMI